MEVSRMSFTFYSWGFKVRIVSNSLLLLKFQLQPSQDYSHHLVRAYLIRKWVTSTECIQVIRKPHTFPQIQTECLKTTIPMGTFPIIGVEVEAGVGVVVSIEEEEAEEGTEITTETMTGKESNLLCYSLDCLLIKFDTFSRHDYDRRNRSRSRSYSR